MFDKTNSYFIDSHCHLDLEPLKDRLDELWQDCQNNNIQQAIIPGLYQQQWQNLQTLTGSHQGLFFAAGIHPWFIKKNSLNKQQFLETLQSITAHKHCVAIGECGLDKLIDENFQTQKEILHWHCQAAEVLQLPLILHVRKAHNELLEILNQYPLKAGGVIHAFTGSHELAQQYWQRGFYLGVGGTITYPRAKKTINAIQQMPLESLLLETDAPDMPLHGFQGEANTPMQLIRIAESLAKIKNKDIESIRQQSMNNCLVFFEKLKN